MTSFYNNIKLLFREKSEKEFFLQLYHLLGISASNCKLYTIAFTHKSITYNVGGNSLKHESNERLEFLGDTVIDMIIADYIFKKYPEESEGFLTKMKSKIVNRKSLNLLGKELHLDVLIKSNIQNIKENDAVGNAFEALIGAIYLDKGYNYTYSYFVSKILLRFFDLDYLEKNDSNFKSQLLEYAQRTKLQISFTSECTNFPIIENQNNFIARIYLNETEISNAQGITKKDAEQNAAKIALVHLEQNN